ncbi:hypothetical protein DICPUDRAFT_32061 [Dictyostelium purpureum]|uniref:Uncharacterized protein n=1 Tax=Dictyostelium purpureum TaxID=5786 RepID=F0ZIA5_DICPU|nr:uncharacterized protein DICPUDRAFT_32061 [Dictyostelium purpureum]EGC36324.1 hypothetical protein DICPUDRAFT_32061 [Dictyostelium purpureum]|eukprot:XP_003287139.1 hypothetical protein DICPUDRAFT_32061 [Dictyostelium purpureum]
MKSWKNYAIDMIKEQAEREIYQENRGDTDSDDETISSYNLKRYSKLKREYSKYYRFKVKNKDNQYLLKLFVQTEFDRETLDFIIETPRWSFITNSLNWAMSWVYTKTDIMGYIGMGKMFILSTNQYKRILRLIYNDNNNEKNLDDLLYLNTMNNIGSGCGTTTLCMAPLFKFVTATEASKGMVYSLKKKGIDSVFCLDIEQCEELKDTSYDIISCLNVLDRCEKPISLLNSIKNFLNPNGKIILAVVYPFRPYVEFGGIDNKPLEHIELKQETIEDYVHSFNTNVFKPNGFELDAFTVAPYISEGDALYQNYVLTDAVFVLKVKDR